jgi:putative (di)nucleoside polyphosphate hydrolase
MKTIQDLPYRPCVGIALFNRDGEVFLGKRAGESGRYAWQMPQGGIDEGEEAAAAARRELYEETGVSSAAFIAQIDDWLCYDLPDAIAGKPYKGRYRGQAQRWFAMRFTGSDSEIRLDAHGAPEFSEWRWASLRETPDLIVPFKRNVYVSVVKAFAKVAKPPKT